MGRRIVIGLLWAVAGYIAGTAAAIWLVEELSSNTHDRSVEAAMTGAFVFGPIVAVICGLVGAARAGRRPPAG
jgi:hypothetical protein